MKNKKWMTAACTAALLGAPLQSLSFLGDNYFLESKGSEEQGALGEETESESETETETESESETETESETGTESESEIAPVDGEEMDTKSVTKAPAESETAAESVETEAAESESEHATEAPAEEMTESEVVTEGERESEVMSEQETEMGSEDITKDETEANTEAGTEPGESERETGSKENTEPVTEPMETESESETVSEPVETETVTEIPTEPVTEPVTEEPVTEPAETEVPTEPAETESETEVVTEPVETESPTEPAETEPVTEPPTEPQRRLIVEQIAVNLPGGEKVYDGTSRIPLSVKTRQEGKGRVGLEIYGEAESADAGVWKVKPVTVLTGTDAGKFELELPRGELTVRIKKRSLTICISDALKEYGAPFSIQGLQFKERSPVQVSGFVRDGVPTSEAPAGFEAPGIDFDLSVIRTDSPMYQNGELITYAGALVPASRGDGTLTGNATENYYFDLSTCQKGSITLVEGKNPSYQVEVRNGKGFYDKDGIFWVSKGSVLLARPDKGSGFNQPILSDAVTEAGEWVFTLERRDRDGSLLASSAKNGFRYRIDDRPPEMKLTGDAKSAGGRIYKRNCQLMGTEIVDKESGLNTVEYSVAFLTEKGKTQDYRPYQPGSAIALEEEGIWQVLFRLRDQVGNERKVTSQTIVIDRTDPVVSVQGVMEGKSYQKEETVAASVEDENLSAKTAVCEVKDQLGRTVFTPARETENGKKLSYDFSTARLADGSYTLFVQAEDLAGNQTEKSVSFRVNRSGSLYTLSSRTAGIGTTYYIRNAENLEVTERNRDQLSKKAIVCVKDGSFRILQEGRDYQTTIQKVGERWLYRYQIFRKCFLEEGVYTLAFQSLDQAGNQSDSREKNTFLEFCIDRTGPVSFLTGLPEDLEPGEAEFTIQARDNGKLAYMELWRNGERLFRTTREKTEVAVELSGTTDFRILAVDQAGNERWSENYRVYVGAEGKKQRQEEDPKEIKTEVWGLNRAGAETEMEETGEIKTLIQRKRMELAAGTKISRGSQTLDEVEELCSGDGWYLKEAGASEKTGNDRSEETEEVLTVLSEEQEAETETSGLKKGVWILGLLTMWMGAVSWVIRKFQ